MVSKKAIIHPNVTLGAGCVVEDFVIIGAPPSGYADGELNTTIGKNAVIRSHTVIYAGNIVGDNFQTGNKANVRELNQIGNNVSIGTLSVVEHHVTIGNGVRIHTQVFIPEYTIIEENCWIGPNAVFTNAKYPNSPMAKKELSGCYLEKESVVGANCTLLPGVRIGTRAIIGAGAVVTKDVLPGMVMTGNPAKHTNTIDNLPYDKE